MLERWWSYEHKKQYEELSGRAAEYFGQNSDEPAKQIEWIYHLLINDPDRAAKELRELGHKWNSNFQYTLVNDLAQVCLEHVTAGRVNGRAKGWVYFWQGESEMQCSNHNKAKSAFEAALSSVGRDSQLEAHCHKALGDAFMELADYTAARLQYDEALRRYNQIKVDKEGKANCLLYLGYLLKRSGEYSQAQKRYEEALKIYREKKTNKVGEAHCLKSLGDVRRDLGDLENAEEHLKEALVIYSDIIGDRRLWTIDCRLSLGGLYMRRGDYFKQQENNEKAREEYQRAQKEYEKILPDFEKLDNKQGEADCWKSLGDSLRKQGREESDEVEKQYKNALSLYKDINNKGGKADCLKSLADMYKALGKYSDAQEQYNEALILFEELGNERMKANCLKDLADTHVGQKKYDDGLKKYQLALKIYITMENVVNETTNCLKDMQKMYMEWCKTDEAQRYEKILSSYQRLARADEQRAVASLRRFLKAEGIIE